MKAWRRFADILTTGFTISTKAQIQLPPSQWFGNALLHTKNIINVVEIYRSKFNRMVAYLIFVIFFTLTKFLENKIYTEKRQFFALNL